MSVKRSIMVFWVVLLATAFPLQAAPPTKKLVKPLKEWSGSVDDLALMKTVPEFILTTDELEKLWKSWKVAGPVPQVDFSKELVLVSTTQGSRLRLAASLDKMGNLVVMGLASRDLRPGFRYVIALVSREGVKTINGKELAAAISRPASPSSLARNLEDFNVADVEVRSVKSLNVEQLNQKIREARQKGHTWPNQAVLVALKCTSEDLKGHTKNIEVRTPPEQRNEAVITITESGYLDDAISGERWKVWLTKEPKGTWTVKRVLWAQLCDRPTHRYYSAEACP